MYTHWGLRRALYGWLPPKFCGGSIHLLNWGCLDRGSGCWQLQKLFWFSSMSTRYWKVTHIERDNMVKAGEADETRSAWELPLSARQMQHISITTVDKGAKVVLNLGCSKSIGARKTELAPNISFLSVFLSGSNPILLHCMADVWS